MWFKKNQSCSTNLITWKDNISQVAQHLSFLHLVLLNCILYFIHLPTSLFGLSDSGTELQNRKTEINSHAQYCNWRACLKSSTFLKQECPLCYQVSLHTPLWHTPYQKTVSPHGHWNVCRYTCIHVIQVFCSYLELLEIIDLWLLPPALFHLKLLKQ